MTMVTNEPTQAGRCGSSSQVEDAADIRAGYDLRAFEDSDRRLSPDGTAEASLTTRALKVGDAARVAPIDKLSVVLVALFGVLFLGEKLSGLNWLGVGLIASGALLVALK